MALAPKKGEYHPLLIPRRGEFFAWLSVGLSALIWLVLLLSSLHVFWLIPLLTIGCLLSALLISLGNWVDRHTTIRIEDDSISYQNGLRKVRMEWLEIQQVHVNPSNWGNRVRVFAGKKYFMFQAFSEVNVLGKVQGRMGFERGDDILRQIVLNSGLQILDQPGEGYYYARK